MKKTWVCVASGPSLSDDQIEHIKNYKKKYKNKLGILVVNDNYKKVSDADVVFAADRHWWKDNYDLVSKSKKMLMVLKGHNPLGDRLTEIEFSTKIDQVEKGMIYHGSNSGQMAIHIVDMMFKPETILLIGYDFQHTGGKAHWFGDHPKKYKANANTTGWLDGIETGMKLINARVINCSLETAIPESVIERGSLYDNLLI